MAREYGNYSPNPSKSLWTVLSVVGIVIVMIMILTSNIFITIDSGKAGVLYKKFQGGTVTEMSFSEGFHVILPWNTMYVYDIRNQQKEEMMEVLSKNGLSIKVDVSVRYFPKADQLGFLHREIGQDYVDKIIIPEIRSSTRKVIGKYDPEELYSTQREAIQNEIFEQTRINLDKKYLILDALLIRSVVLPETIRTAIENKLKQEQESKEYEFRLQKEQKEAERKRIEAKGIKDFQDIVSEGLSDKLLKWKGIEATLELAKSQNSKVIVVGGGKDGLPLILNTKD